MEGGLYIFKFYVIKVEKYELKFCRGEWMV